MTQVENKIGLEIKKIEIGPANITIITNKGTEINFDVTSLRRNNLELDSKQIDKIRFYSHIRKFTIKDIIEHLEKTDCTEYEPYSYYKTPEKIVKSMLDQKYHERLLKTKKQRSRLSEALRQRYEVETRIEYAIHEKLMKKPTLKLEIGGVTIYFVKDPNYYSYTADYAVIEYGDETIFKKNINEITSALATYYYYSEKGKEVKALMKFIEKIKKIKDDEVYDWDLEKIKKIMDENQNGDQEVIEKIVTVATMKYMLQQ